MSLLGVSQQGIVSATKVYTQEVVATKGTFGDQLTAHDLTAADDTSLNGTVRHKSYRIWLIQSMTKSQRVTSSTSIS